MNLVINIIVFLIVLFFYLHIVFQLKTSNDLEIYEIDEPSKENLEEICDLRQPLLFNLNSKIISLINKEDILDNYGAFDIKIRNIKDTDDETELYLPLVYNEVINLFNKDNEKKYISEKNADFIEETGIFKNIAYNDSFLRPSLVVSCNYDIMFGSGGSYTPFRYDLAYRNYFLVTEGKINIRLSPPKNLKYLNVIKDYENFEFRSKIDIWNVQDIYKNDFSKIKCLDVELTKGQIIYIPAYWFYSIKYDIDTLVCNLKYKTYMNIISILPQLFLKFLQNQNIKRKSIELAKNVNEVINKDPKIILDISNSIVK